MERNQVATVDPTARWSGITDEDYIHICIQASHWDGLPEAFRQTQEAIERNPQPIPSVEDLKGFKEKSLLKIFVGQTYPMECVFTIPF